MAISREDRLKEMQALAIAHGGQCLSDKYVNSKTHLLWECGEGHQWEAAPLNIKYGGHWCLTCVHEKKRLGLKAMQELALVRGGLCLSDQYINSASPLLWQCREGHQWESTADSVKNNESWCPVCGAKASSAQQKGKKRGKRPEVRLEDMQDIATRHGGQCLSDEYVNASTHLLWQCSHGHQWEATPASVRNQKTWCPTCIVEERRLGLQAMQELALARGGWCLSVKYVNRRTSLFWKCREGHQWEAAPNNVIPDEGSWCPACARVHDKTDDG